MCALDCPDACGLLINIENGKGSRLRGDPAHPVTRGFLCGKVARYLEREYSPDRLLYPQRRTGAKGEGRFARITWDEALDEIAARLRSAAAEFGPESILPYSYGGSMGYLQGSGMDRRFFHRVGASRLDRTICSAAGSVGLMDSLGYRYGTEPEQFRHSRLILAWGANILGTNVHLWPFIVEARRNGAKLYTIDPHRNRTGSLADKHFFINPGSDTALALGMMHVIIGEKLYDADYVARYTEGFDALRERVRQYPPERTAALTGIAKDEIIQLAREYAAIRPAVIRLNYGLQRSERGAMAVRAISLLPALTGSWKEIGGGATLSTSGAFQVNRAALERPDLQLRSPLGRESRIVNMSQLGLALNELDAPPVKALLVYNSNPAAVAPERNVVLRGLARDDLFTVVLEHFQTDTADWADILLPATTQLEHWDVHLAYGHHYVTLNRPSIAPLGEAKPNSEIFRLLARRMGMNHPSLADDDLTLIRQSLETNSEKLRGVTLDALLERGWMRLNVPSPYLPFAKGGFPTPSGKCELYSERMAQMELDPLPSFTPPYEFPENVPELSARYPLTLISSPAHQFLNSTFVNIDALRRGAREPECVLHPQDAERRAIQSGARVVIHNDRGAFTAVARVEESIREGVVWAPSVWWGKFAADGANANQTTSQRETDLGHGPVFYDNLVDVSLAD